MNVVLKHVLAIIFGALTLGLLIGTQPSKALEQLKVYRGVLVLEGTIVVGDYDKLRTFFGTKSNFDKISGGVFLASPGGNIAEALKIGHLIRALRLSTDAPSGPRSGTPRFGESLITPNHLVDSRTHYLCASACFLVYVSGVYRHLNWVGRLGVHRPTLAEGNAKALSVDNALDLTWRIRDTVKLYLEEMDVPDKYVDLIYSIPPNAIRWVTQSEFDSDLQGFVPEMRDWVGAECNPRTNEEKIPSTNSRTKSPPPENARATENKTIFSMRADQSSDIVKCWMRAKTELSNEAWHKVFLGK